MTPMSLTDKEFTNTLGCNGCYEIKHLRTQLANVTELKEDFRLQSIDFHDRLLRIMALIAETVNLYAYKNETADNEDEALNAAAALVILEHLKTDVEALVTKA